MLLRKKWIKRVLKHIGEYTANDTLGENEIRLHFEETRKEFPNYNNYYLSFSNDKGFCSVDLVGVRKETYKDLENRLREEVFKKASEELSELLERAGKD